MNGASALTAMFWRRAGIRGIGFWAGIRVMLMMSMAVGGARPDPTLHAPTVILLIGAVCGVCALHARAMRESVFLGNLGIGRVALLAPAPFAAAAELIAQLLLRT